VVNQGKLRSNAVLPGLMVIIRLIPFFSSYQEGRDNALVSQLIVVAVKELEYIIEFIKLDGIGKKFEHCIVLMIFSR
jgi:hypothetical protein